MKIVFCVRGEGIALGGFPIEASDQPLQIVLDDAELTTAGGIDQAVAVAVLAMGDRIASELKANLLRRVTT